MQTKLEFNKKKYYPSIIRAIEKAFEVMKRKGYDKLYFYFDIHETILYPDYNNTDPIKFYPYAKEVLQYLSKRSDIVLGLYTCSYPEEIERYQKVFRMNEINFKYVNNNPEAANTYFGCFDHKHYTNVLFDDKAGFYPEDEWFEVWEYFGVEML